MRTARGVLKKQGIVTAVFHNKESAAASFEYLIERDYHPTEIVVVMSQETFRSKFLGQTDALRDFESERSELQLTRYLNKPGATRELSTAGLIVAGPFSTDPALNNKMENIKSLLAATGIGPERSLVYEPELRAGAILLGVLPKGPTDRYTIGNNWRKSEGELILGDDEDF